MLHRVGISLETSDLKQIAAFQKRFGVRSRSEMFRELMDRYEKLEHQFTMLNRCIQGYLEKPESDSGASRRLLKSSLKGRKAEDWS